ncbi:hypothetical protein SAMN04488078_102946 [Antarctobacter heliothermus]|uniref:Uncharacterized protein n=1 Tax=Antarctobacter heliothermus TaxID=74033 RepID=A0A239GX66_9RHOB|nr:hypothetical protein SAMN04488078_102946 [Antarctobacter heliothermus]
MTPFDTTQLVPDNRSIYGAKNSIGCVPPSSAGRVRKLPLNGGKPLVCKNVLWPSQRLGRFLESGKRRSRPIGILLAGWICADVG